MATLGTLAAGVAHELNNPAAATHRSSEQLREAFIRLQENQERLAATTISAHGREYIRTLVEQARQAAVAAPTSTRSDVLTANPK